MTSIIDTLNAANTAPPATTTGSGTALNSALDQKAFLRLMTTQLTTQDPFNPVDNTQMVAQMAQFSQVAGIAEMNQTLRGISTAVGVGGAGRLSEASGWIGRAMLVSSDVATPLRDGTYAGEITLPNNADTVTVSFLDEHGATVHTMELGAKDAGAASFAWDGKDAAGQTVASGPLQVVVNARAAGSQMAATTATWTAIGGLQSPANGGEARLVTGLGLLKPEDAIRIA